jgi:hypothetical protein
MVLLLPKRPLGMVARAVGFHAPDAVKGREKIPRREHLTSPFLSTLFKPIKSERISILI